MIVNPLSNGFDIYHTYLSNIENFWNHLAYLQLQDSDLSTNNNSTQTTNTTTPGLTGTDLQNLNLAITGAKSTTKKEAIKRKEKIIIQFKLLGGYLTNVTDADTGTTKEILHPMNSNQNLSN